MSINWHADGDGRCHAECEAWDKEDWKHLGTRCQIAQVLPWMVRREALEPGVPCPFAVLADVFQLFSRKETP